MTIDVQYKWQCAAVMVDAQRILGSLIYMEENQEKIKALSMDLTTERIRLANLFFLNLYKICDLQKNDLIEEAIKTANETDKEKIKNIRNDAQTEIFRYNPLLKEICVERDKRIAHLDKNNSYQEENYTILKLQQYFDFAMEFAKPYLPSGCSLRPVSFDKVLFRLFNPDLKVAGSDAQPIYYVSDSDDFDISKTPIMKTSLQLDRNSSILNKSLQPPSSNIPEEREQYDVDMRILLSIQSGVDDWNFLDSEEDKNDVE